MQCAGPTVETCVWQYGGFHPSGGDLGCVHSGSNGGRLHSSGRGNSLKCGQAGWGVGCDRTYLCWYAIPHAPTAASLPRRMCADRPTWCTVRDGSGGAAVVRRSTRTAPCIGNEIDRYHKALICQLSIYCYSYLLHNIHVWNVPKPMLSTPTASS